MASKSFDSPFDYEGRISFQLAGFWFKLLSSSEQRNTVERMFVPVTSVRFSLTGESNQARAKTENWDESLWQ
jgi:hypothetical protein